MPALPKSSGSRGGDERAEAGPADPPAARREALDRRSQRLAGLARPQDVVALEQPLDHRFSASEQAEDEGAMGDRLVARRAEPPLERRPADRAQRRGLSGVRRGS